MKLLRLILITGFSGFAVNAVVIGILADRALPFLGALLFGALALLMKNHCHPGGSR